MKDIEFKIKPIGYVRVIEKESKEVGYFLDIKEQYRSALKALDKFSHLMVFWWAHENDRKEVRSQTQWSITPPYGDNPKETGIFATRTEYRPNPIALTTCAIEDVDEKNGIVKLDGIDAFSGTPLVDIKAYFPICDRVRDCYIAPWLKDWPEWVEDGIVWWEEQGFFEDYE